MEKAEQPGVQRLARKLRSCVVSRFFFRVFRPRRRAASAIGRISNERMPDMGEMHADLMCGSGFQAALDKGRKGLLPGSEAFLHPVARARRLALPAQHRHALAVERIAPEVAFDQPVAGARGAPYHRVISALDGMG